MNTLKRENKDYKPQGDIVGMYTEMTTKHLMVKHQMPEEVATAKALKIVSDRLNDFPLDVYHRPNGSDTFKTQTSMLTMIKDTYDKGRIMVPSGTVYENPKVRESFITKQIKTWMAQRGIVKPQSFVEFQNGNYALAAELLRQSTALKTKSNIVSGLTSSSSIVHCKSIHYTLTSTTGTGVSIANTSNERNIAGNYHFRSVNDVSHYVAAILATIVVKDWEDVITKYRLHIPTYDETFNVIWDSAKNYFTHNDHKKEIKILISGLSDLQRCAVIYSGSLYNLRIFNEEVIRTFYDKALARPDNLPMPNDVIKVLSDVDEDIRAVAHHNNFKAMRGVKEGYEGVDENSLNTIFGSVSSVERVLGEYSDLLNTCIMSEVMPLNPLYVDSMIRRTVILSDTDSTCYTAEEWVDWYTYGKTFSIDDSMGAVGLTGIIAVRTLAHHLRQFSSNMGVGERDLALIDMKSEFTWVSFLMATNAAKHYLAGTVVREGNVYKKPDLEIKGVGFKGANLSKSVLDFIYGIAMEVFDKMMLGEQINHNDYLEACSNKYNEIRDAISKNDTTHLQGIRVKHYDEYKDEDPLKTNYRYIAIWNAMYDDIHKVEPGDTFYKYSTTLNTHNKIKESLLNDFKDTMDNKKYEETYKLLIDVMKKGDMGNFPVPAEYIKNNRMPEGLKRIIDIELMTSNITYPIRLLMTNMGYYRAPGNYNIFDKDEC